LGVSGTLVLRVSIFILKALVFSLSRSSAPVLAMSLAHCCCLCVVAISLAHSYFLALMLFLWRIVVSLMLLLFLCCSHIVLLVLTSVVSVLHLFLCSRFRFIYICCFFFSFRCYLVLLAHGSALDWLFVHIVHVVQLVLVAADI
jgi:hypothetical protein